MNKQFIIALVVVLLIWVSISIYYVHYGEKVTKHPCTLCAKKIGDMNCMVNSTPVTITSEKVTFQRGFVP